METKSYMEKRTTFVLIENENVKELILDGKNEWNIGRKNTENINDIELDSIIASRKHGIIKNISGKWYYADKGSKNGTYHNGIMTEVNRLVELENGDVLQIDSEDIENPEKRGVWMLFSTEYNGVNWHVFPLINEKHYIGRNYKECDIIMPLSYVSRVHACISHEADKYYIEDCNSMAGTWINDLRVTDKTELKEKTVISICDCRLIFSFGKIIYGIPKKNNIHTIRNRTASTVILKADIQSKKVPNENGGGLKELIRDVHVEVQEGTLVALLGGAGAGKSTVMNCMNGMETSGMTGTVEYNGVNLLTNFDRMRYLIGSVPQAETFHETLKVEQELTHAARLRLPEDLSNAEIKEVVNQTMEKLGISQIRNNRISKCSGGEKRRVNIGIELVADRQLLCLDEPDAGLDPGNKRRLFETLRDLAHNEGKSILTIIHDVSDIELFDKLIIMNKVDGVGRLAFSGTPAEAKKHFGVDIKDIYGLMAANPEKYVM